MEHNLPETFANFARNTEIYLQLYEVYGNHQMAMLAIEGIIEALEAGERPSQILQEEEMPPTLHWDLCELYTKFVNPNYKRILH